MDRVKELAEEIQQARVFNTPRVLLDDIKKNPHSFSAKSDEDVWVLVCKDLGISADNPNPLAGRKYLYHPDFDLPKNSPNPVVCKNIHFNVRSVRQQIARLLREKGAECLFVDQTERATFLSNHDYHEGYSTRWAGVEVYQDATVKITHRMELLRPKETFCWSEEPIHHPHIVPEWHVYPSGNSSCLVSVAPNHSNTPTLFDLFKKYTKDAHNYWNKHIIELFEILRDAMMGYEEKNARNQVDSDAKSPNILAPEKNGQRSGMVSDSLDNLRAGTPLDPPLTFYTPAYSEKVCYLYRRGERHSYASDVFSLGCTILELITKDPSYYQFLANLYNSFQNPDNKKREYYLFQEVNYKVNSSGLPDDIKPGVIALIQSMVQADQLSRPQFNIVIQIFDRIIEAIKEASRGSP